MKKQIVQDLRFLTNLTTFLDIKQFNHFMQSAGQ
uniref:Uncharacterized protein n=1 Tax=Setaria italica TaxID=4555 RepID=K3XU53_SETIT